MSKSCLNCKSQYICRGYIRLYQTLNSDDFKITHANKSIVPGVHGEIYRSVASNCNYYEEDK